MATKVHMEALSPTMEEGQVVSWLKNEGDAVAEGDVLAEIETDKATMELVARGEGVLRKQLLAEGRSAPVGAVIGVIAAEDEDIAAILEEAGSGAGPAEAGPAAAPEPSTREEADVSRARDDVSAPAPTEREQVAEGVAAAVEAPQRPATPEPGSVAAPGAGGPPGGGNGAGRVKASPLARRLAAENDIELGGVSGSGPGGRIIKRDIEAALEGGAPAAATARLPAVPAPVPFQAPGPQAEELVEIPVSQMRKTIAKRLVTSIGPVPTFYLTIDVDMTRMAAARHGMNARLEERGQKVSVNDLLLRAVAGALRQHPEVNASWGETVVRRYGRVHLGVAVAVEDGLITPVVRDADRKGVAQIAREVRELAARARQRKLQPEEYTGATFSVSNLGMFGIEEFTAIINPPEGGILAVGRMEDRPVVQEGEVIVQPRMRMTMSCDHRVIDGATGARFLQTLKGYIEEPMLLLA